MAENHNPEKRHSSSSTISLPTKTAKIKEFTRADKKNKTNRPVEAISEVAINNLRKEDESESQLKRIHSAPHGTTAPKKNNQNTLCENTNHNTIFKKQPSDVKISIDSYLKPQPNLPNTTIHYASPKMDVNRPTVHYISGHINQGFVGPIHNQYTQNHSNNNTTSNRVHREQYWLWPCCQQSWNWTRREKTFSLIIVGQSFIIFGLLVAVFVTVFTDNDITLCKSDILEPPWKLN